MRIHFLLTVLLAVSLGFSTGTARDQWVISGHAYDVDTLIYPHLVGPGVTSAGGVTSAPVTVIVQVAE